MNARRKKPPTIADQLAEILPAGIASIPLANGSVSFGIDPSSSPDRFKSIGGSNEAAVNIAVLSQVLALIPSNPDPWIAASRVAAAVALVEAFAPKDPVEAMLAIQAVACHMMGMEAARRTLLPEQPAEFTTRLRKDAANMMRANTEMLDALARHRGKGPQVVRVERVVVQDGGQAIVGQVHGGPPRLDRPEPSLRLAAAAVGGCREGVGS